MKRTIFLQDENAVWLKGNLHSHSTRSDGKLTPEEMKNLYKSRGYSILCCTDHEIMIGHHDLTDDDFLMLTGFELGFDESWRPDFLDAKVCDLCVIALDKDNLLIVSGTGEVIEPDDGIAAIGSGGNYAFAAAKALKGNTDMSAKEIVQKSMEIAASICVFTNDNIYVDEI